MSFLSSMGSSAPNRMQSRTLMRTLCVDSIFSYRTDIIRFAANCTRVDGPLYPGKIYTVLTIEIVLHLVNPSQSTPSTTDFTFFLTCPLFLLSTAVAAHHV
jgi:hypothetical protein